MFEKRILNAYAVIIGVLFILSGIGKVIDTAGFSTLIYQYGLGYFMVLAPLIVLIELLIGLFLVLLIQPKRYAMVSFVLLVIFTASFGYAFLKNGVTDCGCFGSTQHSSLPPVFSFLRNLILIAMSLIIWIKYPAEKNTVQAAWKTKLIMVVMAVAIFTAGFTFKTPFLLQSKPTAHKFQNQPIAGTELSGYINTSPDSTYLIFCFSYTCPYCLNSIENLRQYQKTHTVDSVLVFAIGAPRDKLVFNQNFKPDFPITDLSAQAMDKLTTAYPVAFYIEHDSVKAVVQSELPSPFIFKKMYGLK